jgi:hypothetical protein
LSFQRPVNDVDVAQAAKDSIISVNIVAENIFCFIKQTPMHSFGHNRRFAARLAGK